MYSFFIYILHSLHLKSYNKRDFLFYSYYGIA